MSTSFREMMDRRFKHIPMRADRSFRVIVKFETLQNAEALQDEITEWCKVCVEDQNADPRFKHARIDKNGKEWQAFDYFRAFSAPPSVFRAEGTELWLRFEGVPDSYWWRDWLARMLTSLRKAFPVRLVKEQPISFDDNV